MPAYLRLVSENPHDVALKNSKQERDKWGNFTDGEYETLRANGAFQSHKWRKKKKSKKKKKGKKKKK